MSIFTDQMAIKSMKKMPPEGGSFQNLNNSPPEPGFIPSKIGAHRKHHLADL